MPILNPIEKALKRHNQLLAKSNKAWAKAYAAVDAAKALSQETSRAAEDVTHVALTAITVAAHVGVK